MKFVKPRRNFSLMDLKTPGIILISGTAGSRCSNDVTTDSPSPSPPTPNLFYSLILVSFCVAFLFSDRFSPHEDSPAAPGLNVPPGCNLKRERSHYSAVIHIELLSRDLSWPCLDYMTFPKPITVSRSYACCEEDVGSPVWWLCTEVRSESQCCIPKCSKPFLVRVMGS